MTEARSPKPVPDEAEIRQRAERVRDRIRRYSEWCEAPLFEPCQRCHGKGSHHGYGEHGCDPDWCPVCGGQGEQPTEPGTWSPDDLLKEASELLDSKVAPLVERTADNAELSRLHGEAVTQALHAASQWQTAESELARLRAERREIAEEMRKMADVPDDGMDPCYGSRSETLRWCADRLDPPSSGEAQ